MRNEAHAQGAFGTIQNFPFSWNGKRKEIDQKRNKIGKRSTAICPVVPSKKVREGTAQALCYMMWTY